MGNNDTRRVLLSSRLLNLNPASQRQDFRNEKRKLALALALKSVVVPTSNDMASARLLESKMLKTPSLIFIGMILSFILWEIAFNGQSLPDLKIPQQFSLDLPGCLAIISGNTEGKKGDFEVLLKYRNRQNLLSEDFYLNLTKDCPSYIEERGFITAPLSEEERNFPIAYSMVIHEKIEMFERLLRAVYNPQNIYCVHVDQKATKEFKKAVEAILSCFPNVFIASRLESVVYASWYRVQADLNCMDDLLNSQVQWRYLLNTCGADFPIKTNREMIQALKALNGKNSMETEITQNHKKRRWMYHFNVTTAIVRTDVKKSPPPISSPMFQGNAYFVATRAFVEHVMQDKEVQKLLEWEKDTYSPDEHLWATLQRMPSVPGSTPANRKYDASDLHAIARLVKWADLEGDVENGAPYSRCTGSYRNAICVYGAGDLRWLLRQHHLFANKFDPAIDDIAIRCLESVLRLKALGHDPLGTDQDSTILL